MGTLQSTPDRSKQQPSSSMQQLFPAKRTRCEDSNTPPPPADDAIAQAARSAHAYTNPGPYEMVTSDGKRLVQLDTYEGFRCDIQKQMSPFMLVLHSFALGTQLPDGRKSSYSFMTQFAEEANVLIARVDPGRGSVDGRYHRALPFGTFRTQFNLDGQNDQLLADLDVGGQTWTGNLKLASMGGAVAYGCNYLQTVTPKLTMGGEGLYLAANQGLMSSYTLKYSFMAPKVGDVDVPLPKQQPGMPPIEPSGASTVLLNFNAAQSLLTCNYKRVVTANRVTLGAELQCNPLKLDESALLLGAEFKLQRSRVAISADGSGRVQSVVEAKLGLAPQSPSLNFSADVDHVKDEMKFGFGLNIEG